VIFKLKIIIFILSISLNLFSSQEEEIIGNISYYNIREGENLIEISRKNNLSFPEVMIANPKIKDPWLPKESEVIILPKRHILPNVKKEGVVVNKGDLRVYYYGKNSVILSYPIGIGRGDWETPTGKASIVGKKKNPYWTVPKSILEEEPHWPNVVKPGPDNPLGTRAIYLSMTGYLLHGTNKPWGVGMKVSHGCIRLFPEDIEELFEYIKIGDKVNVIDQPVKAGWSGGVLYLEVHTMHPYGLEDGEKIKPNIRLLPEAARIIQSKAGTYIGKINWKKVTETVSKASGMPEAILTIYD
tara:strand:- start:220 stop:1116 length:897 start_codon:yes stop_codon:yes gene_type:complete